MRRDERESAWRMPGRQLMLRLGAGLVLIVAMLLAACAGAQETPTAEVAAAPTNTTAATETPLPPTETPQAKVDSPGEMTFETVEIEELGLTVEVPEGWTRLEPEWVWTPEEGSALLLGVSWIERGIDEAIEPAQNLGPLFFGDQVDIEEVDPIDLGWASGRTFMVEVPAEGEEGAALQEHTLVQVPLSGGGPIVSFNASAPDEEGLESLLPALEHLRTWSVLSLDGLITAETAGWQRYEDPDYGFAFQYPADWVLEEVDLQAEGAVEDWPLKRSLALYPQAWEDDILSVEEGDIDIVPLKVEVVFGGPSDYQLVYVSTIDTVFMLLDDIELRIEDNQLGEEARQYRYVFFQPDEEEEIDGRYVVLIDRLSAFPDERDDSEDVLALIPQIVTTFAWTE